MSFLIMAAARERHLAAGVLSTMMRDDCVPADGDARARLDTNRIACRIWAMSDKNVGFPVIFDTVSAMLSLGYVRRDPHAAIAPRLHFRTGLKREVQDWIAREAPTSLLPEPRFRFYRYATPMPSQARDRTLRMTGAPSSMTDTVRIAMVEVSPFGEHGVSMMYRIDGPDDQFRSGGAMAAGLSQETIQRMSGWRYELENSFDDGGTRLFRIDQVHAGMTLDALTRVASRHDIAAMLDLGSAVSVPDPSIRAANNEHLIQAAFQFRSVAEMVQREMAEEHRATLRRALPPRPSPSW